jgi:multidrug efflux pump subunit AcrB
VRHILGKDINYIFTWVQGVDNTSILIRLHDKDHLESAMESLKQGLGQDARLTINVDQWTFSEFKVPSPPDWQISISGSDQNDRASLAKEISDRLTSRRLIASHELVPNFSSRKVLSLSPREGVWSGLQHEGFQFSPASLVDELRVMYQGKWIGDLLIGQQSMPMVLSYPEAFSQKLADLKALPVWVGSSLVPFEALMDVSIKPPAQTLFKEDGRDLARVEVRLEKNEGEEQRFLEGAQRIIQEVTKERAATGNPAVSIGIEKPNPEYQDSMFNLALAMVGSILLMAVIVILQFGSLRDSLLVLTAVPTGLMGAILSLYCFNSILSLNAILGMTLLNGISINNSIMLVDYARKSLRSGEAAFSAIIHAASTRLRPILITTITTVLGMTPLALGFGEGGKVLQPLSLAVVGGLWISTAVTIIIIPVVFAKFGETRTYDKA